MQILRGFRFGRPELWEAALEDATGAGAGMPTADAIRHTADKAPSDPAAANAQMLQGYFDLSTTLGRLLHGYDAVANATFPTFATWTTETLRVDVAAEDGTRDGNKKPRRPLAPYGLVRPGRVLYRRVAGLVLGDDDVVARNLARGEAAIYEEIGLAVRTLVAIVRTALQRRGDASLPAGPESDRWWRDVWTQYTNALVAECDALDTQRQEPEQPEAVGVTDRAVLQEAVLPYFRVLADGLTRYAPDDHERKRRADGKKRAELILLGTIRLEAYAQTRLQPVLRRNLGYLPDAIRTIVGTRLTGRTNRSTAALRRLYERSRRFSGLMDEAFEIAATRHVFGLVIGDEVLRLGVDLPLAPPANPTLRDRQPALDQERYALGAFFPRDLQSLRQPDVWTAWQQFDRSSGEGARTAVDDWLRYEERLSFIVNLFRSRQQVTALYNPPGSLPPAVPPRPASIASVLPAASDATKRRLEHRDGSRA